MCCWCGDFNWSRRAFSFINFSERYDNNNTKEVKTKSFGVNILVLPWLCTIHLLFNGRQHETNKKLNTRKSKNRKTNRKPSSMVNDKKKKKSVGINPAFLYFRQRYNLAVRSMTFFWHCKMTSVQISWFKFLVQNSTIIKIHPFLHFKGLNKRQKYFRRKDRPSRDIECLLYMNMKYSLFILK